MVNMTKELTPEYICEDSDVWGYDRNFSTKVFLQAIKSPRLKDMPLMESWIEEACRQYDVSQKFILCTMEKEQSFITREAGGKGWEHALNYTLGFGATDSVYITKYKGVKRQIFAAAKAVGTWYREKAAKRVGVPCIIDNKPIIAKNAGTAAQYIYTPHIEGAMLFGKVLRNWEPYIAQAYINTTGDKSMQNAEIQYCIIFSIDNKFDSDNSAWGYLIKRPNIKDGEAFIKLREILEIVSRYPELTIDGINWEPDYLETEHETYNKRPPIVIHLYTKDFPLEYRYSQKVKESVQNNDIPDVQSELSFDLPVMKDAQGKPIVKVFPSGLQMVKLVEDSVSGPGQEYYNPHAYSWKGLFQTSAYINKKVGKYFNVNEFLAYASATKAGYSNDWKPKFFRLHPWLVERLDQIREHFNKPIVITSGFRPHKYNKVIGGAVGSYHLSGMAADFYVSGVAASAVKEYIEKNWPNNSGLGYYNTWLHLDVRNYRSRWNG